MLLVISVYSLSFSLSDHSKHFTVPHGYDIMTITATGGSGGFSTGGVVGGLGGFITANFSVIPGQTFYVCVGGAGGSPLRGYYNGGTGGFYPPYNIYGGGGGGSSDVLTAGTCSRIITAGGGGGAGAYYAGGAGGAITTADALPSNAQSASTEYRWPTEGGGGGGYIGGFAGSGKGGTGGTSYTTGTLLRYKVGANSGNGKVFVSFFRSGKPIPPAVSSPSGACQCIPPNLAGNIEIIMFIYML